MSQFTYAANLASDVFPFLAKNKTRSVIVPQLDQQYVSGVAGLAEKEKFIPDLFYMENVVPTVDGFQSVSFRDTGAGEGLPADETILQAIKARPRITNNITLQEITQDFFIILTSKGNLYAYTPIDTNYYLLGALPSPDATYENILSEANINGTQYIHINHIGTFYWQYINDLVAQTLTGLDFTAVRGILASSGYMIAWTDTDIAWSSLITPTDFTPSLITGAGGGAVQEIRGIIVYCLPIAGGFIIYTTQNIVAAMYTQNSRYPFNFKELKSGGGIPQWDIKRVTATASGQEHYVQTTVGIQQVTVNSVENLFPEVMDFLGEKILESFNPATCTFSYERVPDFMQSITLVSSRYLVISYCKSPIPPGTGSFDIPNYYSTTYTHALIYDLGLKRWGKLKYTHRWCLDYPPITFGIINASKNSICFISDNSAVSVLDFNVEEADTGGIVIFGKYQYVRTNLLQLETVEIENVASTDAFLCRDMYSFDGKTIAGVAEPTSETIREGLRSYTFHQVGLNHSIVFSGKFYATSLILTGFPHGRR